MSKRTNNKRGVGNRVQTKRERLARIENRKAASIATTELAESQMEVK